MAFKFIDAAATGSYQTLFNRGIEDPESIDLTDTPGANSTQSIPFDGIDDRVQFDGIIQLSDIEPNPTSLAFDVFLKNTVTAANTRYTFFDASIVKDSACTTSGYDGFYIGSVVVTGASDASFIEFRVNHSSYPTSEYVLTSAGSITTSAWHNVFCNFNSGAQSMEIWIDGTLDSSSTLTELNSLTTSPLGQRGINFGGRLDELRLWVPNAAIAATSIGQLSAVTAISVLPEDLAGGAGVNEFTPSANSFIGWWNFESISAVELIAGLLNSINDATDNGHSGTPFNFNGSDLASAETTIVNGISASGDLRTLLGGSLDHGGLLVLDPQDNTIITEFGAENLIDEGYNTWTATGDGVSTSNTDGNVHYGASARRISTTADDTGVYQEFSNSALIYADNIYTVSIRLRGITGSTSAIFNLHFGSNFSSTTAVFDTAYWDEFVLTGKADSSTTGKVEIKQAATVAGTTGSLFLVDGLQLVEGDYGPRYILHSRLRKSGQLSWQVEG